MTSIRIRSRESKQARNQICVRRKRDCWQVKQLIHRKTSKDETSTRGGQDKAPGDCSAGRPKIAPHAENIRASGTLSSILREADARNLESLWNATDAAPEYTPLPPGQYTARIIDGQLISSRTHNTPGYELTFEVVEGEFRGRRIWHSIWLTEAALPRAKRDLAKLGISDLHQLAAPLPPGMRCHIDVVIRRDDADVERNRVRRFEVVGVDKPEPDPYAPAWDAVDWDDADYDNEESNVSEDEPIDMSQHLALDEDDDNDQLLMHA